MHEFQSSPCDRLPPTTARLAGLVSEEKAIPLSVKRNLPFISKSGDIVGSSPRRSRDQEHRVPAVLEKGQRRRQVNRNRRRSQARRRRRSQVASSGPPRTKEVTPPAHSQPSKPIASESQGRAGKARETTPLRSKC
ncbi:uncharacterized protein Pyn_34312 [Prunus yedoensis var. nudiflora]|uniref:Uncharacterized protein n=1 Tax=Prunus yedoensis var. nudiflora TaxID=2094558 RepID=A0A314Z920_PRUYE|nr:uncharacterized protein Pyn_34312 [Prunus yedoensis var. nudiflora]